ncbi:MAG: MotA/TolQ/ExbB proton channel family protein [Myxococcota bacterium]
MSAGVLRTARGGLVGALLFALGALPLLWMARLGEGWRGTLDAAWAGFAGAVDAVGWVLVPQVILAVAVFGVALQHAASRLAGTAGVPPPAWIDPAVESALLLGMLGTLSGMVNGFAGLTPDALEPGPLVHALGTALRSSFVGFGIALVGVWVRALPAASPEAS